MAQASIQGDTSQTRIFKRKAKQGKENGRGMYLSRLSNLANSEARGKSHPFRPPTGKGKAKPSSKSKSLGKAHVAQEATYQPAEGEEQAETEVEDEQTLAAKRKRKKEKTTN